MKAGNGTRLELYIEAFSVLNNWLADSCALAMGARLKATAMKTIVSYSSSSISSRMTVVSGELIALRTALGKGTMKAFQLSESTPVKLAAKLTTGLPGPTRGV